MFAYKDAPDCNADEPIPVLININVLNIIILDLVIMLLSN